MKLNTLLNGITQIILYTSYIVMTLTFLHAYTNNHQTLITINTYGEAHIELILILTSIPIITKTTHQHLKQTTTKNTTSNIET